MLSGLKSHASLSFWVRRGCWGLHFQPLLTAPASLQVHSVRRGVSSCGELFLYHDSSDVFLWTTSQGELTQSTFESFVLSVGPFSVCVCAVHVCMWCLWVCGACICVGYVAIACWIVYCICMYVCVTCDSVYACVLYCGSIYVGASVYVSVCWCFSCFLRYFL